jgi:PAS domain S-box-containing protein
MQRHPENASQKLLRVALVSELERLRSSEEQLRLENEQLHDNQRLLEQARDTYAELYDFAPLAGMTLDRADSIQYVNLAAASLLAQERQRLIGSVFRRFVVPEQRAVYSQHMARCRAQANEQSIELRLVLADGSALPVQLWTRRSSSNAEHCQLTLVDLRDRERAAEERQRLLESEQKARQASASKDKFIAMLSHELRTPLTPVLAAASAFHNRSGLPSDIRKAFEMIERNVATEARLIDDLLDLSGIVRGKVRIVRQPTDVHQTLREAIELLREDAARKGQALRVELSAEHHHTNGDRLRLRQVFWNLLRNAIKFTPNQGQIHVRSWNHAQRLAIEVDDTGPGIDPAALPRLFEPFDQLDREASPAGGLGLGLAISKGLIELHGGQIAAHSRGQGCGTRFVVELDVLARPTTNVEANVEPPRSVAAAGDGGRPRILLVEDHVDTIEVMQLLLEAQGYDVQPAVSIEAARAVDLSQVDLIVSDLGLPDGTGTDLIRELQARDHRPAIALSGFGMQADLRASKEAGFDIHLTKPVDFGQLLDAIRSLSGPIGGAPRDESGHLTRTAEGIGGSAK